VKTRIVRDFSILVLIFGALWLIGILFFFNKEDTQLLSVDKEIKLGEYFYDNLRKDPQFNVVGNTYTDSCMQVLISRLTDSLDTEYDYNIHIFNNPMINAFALPGGNILVSSGLIGQCDKAEELAAVIAHEMAHIEKKHLIGKLMKDLGMTILTSDDSFLIGEVSRSAASTAYDRKKEKEADAYALKLMERSAIDPRILGVFFRKLKDKNLDYDKRFEMIMTHPPNDTRIRMALEYRLPENFKARPIELDWHKLQISVNKLTGFEPVE
jgi:predicted Zn-dependent protease